MISAQRQIEFVGVEFVDVGVHMYLYVRANTRYLPIYTHTYTNSLKCVYMGCPFMHIYMYIYYIIYIIYILCIYV
jgi:hypothetical protein